KRGRRIEAGLIHLHVDHTQRLVVDAVTSAQNGLGRHGIGEADARQELLMTWIPEIAREAAHARKSEAAANVELAHRNVRNWILRVVLQRLRPDGARARRVEAFHAAVVSLRERRGQLVSQAQAERELAAEPEIVLRVEGPVAELLGDVVIDR